MKTIKVQKGFPIPTKNAHKIKYPWATMEIGESFLYENYSAPQRTYDANCKYKPKKFTCARDGEFHRVWRKE